MAKDRLFEDGVSSRTFERRKTEWDRESALVGKAMYPRSLTLWCPLTGIY